MKHPIFSMKHNKNTNIICTPNCKRDKNNSSTHHKKTTLNPLTTSSMNMAIMN